MFLTNERGRSILIAMAIAIMAVGLSGCRDYPEWDEYRARTDSITLEHGNAVAHNIAVQTVDPWPPNVRDTDIDIDGERSVIAAKRYKQNKVIPPRGLATQDIVVVGGGGQGGATTGQ